MAISPPSERPERRPVPLVPLAAWEREPAATLPQPLTTFVGRDHEAGAAAGLLRAPEVRLLTLTGPGGVGKTRLALRLAEELADEFADGVAFVGLAVIVDPGLVLPAIAQALEVREAGDRSLPDRLAHALRARHLLLVLDNFEQVVVAAPQVAALLAAGPRLKLLITSQIPLHLTGEQEFSVPPLRLPDAGRPPALAELADGEAVALFVQRARAVRPDFALTAENAAAVAEICRRLDGLPLAIELAAARTKILSPAALLARLADRLRVLTGGPADHPARLQTMSEAVAWSHNLLSEDEQALFRRLAVFAGGFTLEMAEAVGGADDLGLDVLDGVTALVDHSLLRQESTSNGGGTAGPRFRMLATIKQFAWERLAASGEEEEVRRRHAAAYLLLVGEAQPALFGPEQKAWADLLQREHDNLRAAMTWALERGDAETSLGLIGGLWQFWFMRGHLSEGRGWIERALGLLPAVAGMVPAHVEAIFGAGVLAHQQGDYRREVAAGEELVVRSRVRGDRWGEARGKYLLSRAAESEGDVGRSAALAEAALRVFRDLGDRQWTAYTLNRLGLTADGRGDRAGATGHFEEALGLWRELGNTFGVAIASDNLAGVARAAGDFARGATASRESLARYWELGDPVGTVEGLIGIAVVATAAGRLERATRLLGAAEALREATGFTLYAFERAEYERTVPLLRERLGEEAFAAAWAAGQRLAVEEAVAEALAPASDQDVAATSRPDDKAASHGLTPREAEVLRLLVAGRTDREIADALFISRRTAQGHVANLFAKLGVNTRTAAATAAIAAGLASAEPGPPT